MIELTDQILSVVIGLSMAIVFTIMSVVKPDPPFFSIMAGFTWIAVGMFVLYDYGIIYLFLSLGVGLYLFLVGVAEYV